MNLILFRRNEVDKVGKWIPLQDKDPRTKHIVGHLRKVDGDSVTIGIISGGQGKAILRVTEDGEKKLELDLGETVNGSSSLFTMANACGEYDDGSPHEIVLVLSLPFPKRLKGLWPQISSMGVTRICIIQGMLSDPSYHKSSTITPEVYRPLVEEGMSQGCHTKEVTVDVDVDKQLSCATLEKLGLVKQDTMGSVFDEVRIFLDCGDETSEPLPCRKVIMNQIEGRPSDTSERKRVFVAIGSERGWTDDEAKLFHEAGYESASLGRSILRVDTAVIAALGIVSATLDELEINQNAQRKQNGEEKEDARKRKHET